MSTQALKTAVAGAAEAKKPAGLPALLQQMRPQLALALPKHMNPDRMVRIALTELRKNPMLMKADPQTVMASVVMAAQLGLEPGLNGQAYLIPYENKRLAPDDPKRVTCTLVPGWKGLVDLAQRSGRASVWTGAVYEGDHFDYEFGTSPFLKHKPAEEFNPKAQQTHAYAVGRVRGAEYPVIEVWPMAQVFGHRDRFNKVGTRHYSFEHPEMYSRKVALLQVLKYMPQSIELSTAMDMENAAEMGRQKLDMSDAIDGTFVPTHVEESTDEGQQQPQQGQQDQESPIAAAAADELFRAAKTEADVETAWQRIVASYRGVQGGVPLPIEAARNTFREQIREAAAKAGAK